MGLTCDDLRWRRNTIHRSQSGGIPHHSRARWPCVTVARLHQHGQRLVLDKYSLCGHVQAICSKGRVVRLRIGWCIYIYIPDHYSCQEISLQRSAACSVSSVLFTCAPRRQDVSFVEECERCCGGQDPGQQTRRSILRSEHSKASCRVSSSPILKNVFTCCEESRIRSSS